MLMQIHFVEMAAISRTVIIAEFFEYFDQIKIWSWDEINLAGEEKERERETQTAHTAK